ncbi:MAG: BtpA/SgcQ family protein [Candidatus Saliniplasma sp.]
MEIEDNTVIGMVHLLPLPGSPNHKDMSQVVGSALEDVRSLEEGGVDALIVENYGDKPYRKTISDKTRSAFTDICEEIGDETTLPIGVNVLRNDWRSALRISDELDLSFIRVNVYTGVTLTDQGIIEGEAAQIQSFKDMNSIRTSIFADIHVKHGKTVYPDKIETAAEDAVKRGSSDTIIVSGPRTGEPVDIEGLKAVKEKVDVPVLVGSGVRLSNVNEILQHSNGAIVGTAFKYGSITENKVSRTRVDNFIRLFKG